MDRRAARPPAARVEKLPLFALAAASSVITLVVQQRGGATTNLDALPAATGLANALVAYMQYLAKLVWPTNMAIFYRYREALPWWWIACALVAMVALSVFAWRARRDRAYLTTGWFWFAGTLVPVIGLIQVGRQAMADRYTYVPYVGLFIAIAWAGHWALSRLRLPASVAVAIAVADVAGSAALTASQVRVWQSHETVWKHAAAVTSGNYIAVNELGMLLAAEKRHAEALQYFETAVREKPGFPEARNNLGLTYGELGRPPGCARAIRARGPVETGLSRGRAQLWQCPDAGRTTLRSRGALPEGDRSAA